MCCVYMVLVLLTVSPTILHPSLSLSLSLSPLSLSLSPTTAPAIVEPGDNTTTDVEEDGFRFFQSVCPAFSVTIMIEQIDLVGSCSLYASNQIQNPGKPK